MGDTESCSSRAVDLALSQSRNRRQKFEVYNDVLCRLKHYNDEEACVPDFEDELWSHFQRLPTRYALDVNVERAQDVLMHKRLLQTAHNPATRPAIEVRLVQVHSALEVQCGVQGVFCSDNPNLPCVHPPPAFGSLPDAEPAHNAQDTDVTRIASPQCCSRLMHEITISTLDKPKLLSQLTSLLSDIGLNIQEAHAFSTTDGYSLDVFVVDNWSPEETEELRSVVLKEIPKIEKHDGIKPHIIYPVGEQEQTTTSISNRVNIPSDRLDVWEIDVNLLKYENKIASGSYGDLYKGTFCSQDVAIKVLRTQHLNDKLRREFAQEVFIMRKIRHKNVVQFIGASTRPPKLCIVTEYMCGGSMYDFLHKQKRKLNLEDLIRVAIDVSKGMSYLHQNSIIHRDLKAANLLIDENGVVKVADFGVARVQDESGVMTAETGTYRWMAPEVIAHRPYDHKADVFSFSIVLWELLTGKLPYEQLTPLQAAVGVAQQGLRPLIPSNTHPQLVQLLENCWQQNPLMRPGFSEILDRLQELARMVTDQIKDRQRKKSSTKMLRGERQQNN